MNHYCAAATLNCPSVTKDNKDAEFSHAPIWEHDFCFCSEKCKQDYLDEIAGFWETMGDDPCGKDWR